MKHMKPMKHPLGRLALEITAIALLVTLTGCSSNTDVASVKGREGGGKVHQSGVPVDPDFIEQAKVAKVAKVAKACLDREGIAALLGSGATNTPPGGLAPAR